MKLYRRGKLLIMVGPELAKRDTTCGIGSASVGELVVGEEVGEVGTVVGDEVGDVGTVVGAVVGDVGEDVGARLGPARRTQT